MRTAGRSVLFSGLTVAISLAALIALPVPFLRSVGFTGLLIPVLSVAAALTLLPALLLVAGGRLAWPHRRSGSPDSKAWHRVGADIVRPEMRETTALGSAILAGSAVGLFGWDIARPETLHEVNTAGSTVFKPSTTQEYRDKKFKEWNRAVERCRGWATVEED